MNTPSFSPDPLAERLKEQAEFIRLEQRIIGILADPVLSKAAEEDSVQTFMNLGMTEGGSRRLFSIISDHFLRVMAFGGSLKECEEGITCLLQATVAGEATVTSQPKIIDTLHGKLADRAHLIHSQISPHLSGTQGRVLDFGAGDLQVTQLLQDADGLDIAGVDVRDYRKETGAQKPVPFELYNGRELHFPDRSFEAVIATNVLHHAGETHDGNPLTEDNEPALAELCRLANDKIVIIETVPDPEHVKQDLGTAMERTFWNDYLYNRLFHSANVPVPGRYETREGWVDRFANHGWELVEMKNLGYDQPTIRDYHVLYVFRRKKNDVETIAIDANAKCLECIPDAPAATL